MSHENVVAQRICLKIADILGQGGFIEYCVRSCQHHTGLREEDHVKNDTHSRLG